VASAGAGAGGGQDFRGGVVLPRAADAAALEAEAGWLGDLMRFHLDEEWCPLDVHADLGRKLAEAYRAIRSGGEDELGGIILALSGELLAFDFTESFVNAFEVSNKAGELLMMRAGMEVCCTSPADATLIERFDRHRQAAAGGPPPQA